MDLNRVVRGPGGVRPAVDDPAPDCGDRQAQIFLTSRQRQIVELVSHGRTNQEIGRALGLAKNTVKTYWQQALAELGARNRVEAISRAREAGLI
jgi:two-component system nitrate/nitrite response regulator NarL